MFPIADNFDKKKIELKNYFENIFSELLSTNTIITILKKTRFQNEENYTIFCKHYKFIKH